MVRLQCPQCGTTIEAQPGMQAVCPSCGFSAEAPPSAPMPVGGYSATPYGGAGGYSPPPSPTPYPPPPAGYPGQPQMQVQRTNGLAVAALVMGILGFCMWVPSVLAIVFGIIARNQCRERHEAGEGMAMAGIVMGVIVVVITILYFAFFISFFNAWGEI